MFWVVLFLVAIIAVSLDTANGKIVIGAGITAIGMLLLKWITGIAFFVTLAKLCAVIMVVTVIGSLLLSIVK